MYSCRYSIIHLSWFHPPFKGFRGSMLRSEWNKEEISPDFGGVIVVSMFISCFAVYPWHKCFLNTTDFTSLASLSSFFQPSEKCSQVTGEGTNINTNFGQLVSHAVISPTFDFQCSISRKMTYTYIVSFVHQSMALFSPFVLRVEFVHEFEIMPKSLRKCCSMFGAGLGNTCTS